MRRGGSLLLALLMGMAGVEGGVGQAAEPREAQAFTIDELVSRALAENPELQAARAEVEAASGRLLQAGLRPNPMLDVGFQKSVTGPDNNVMAGVTLPLDLNRRQAGRLGVAERELALKQAQVAERERMLRAEVRLKAGELLAARSEVDMAGAKVRKEEAEGRWDASVNVGYMRQDFGYGLNGLTEQGELRPITDVFHYVGGGITVTLPVRNRNQGNIAAALAEAQAGGRRLDAAALLVRQEVAAAFTQQEAAERALATYTRGVWEVARQNLAVVRKAYELGRHPLLEVIAEQRRYIEVEMGYTDVLKHAYDAAVARERALGVMPH